MVTFPLDSVYWVFSFCFSFVEKCRSTFSFSISILFISATVLLQILILRGSETSDIRHLYYPCNNETMMPDEEEMEKRMILDKNDLSILSTLARIVELPIAYLPQLGSIAIPMAIIMKRNTWNVTIVMSTSHSLT